MHLDDRTRLVHMVDAAHDVISFAAGASRSSLDQNKMLALALVRCIEIIGEAANGLSEKLRSSHPEIPWPKVAGLGALDQAFPRGAVADRRDGDDVVGHPGAVGMVGVPEQPGVISLG